MVAGLLSFHSPPPVSGDPCSRFAQAASALSRNGRQPDQQALVGQGRPQITASTNPFLISSQALANQTRACRFTSPGDNHRKRNSGGVDPICIGWFSEHWSKFHALWIMIRLNRFIRKIRLLHRTENQASRFCTDIVDFKGRRNYFFGAFCST